MSHLGTGGSTEWYTSLEYATNEDISRPLGNSIASKRSSSSTLQTFIGQYYDVFPYDLSNGLPPKRSVELKINHVADAKPARRHI
jgi:hypothetical protein